MLWTVSEAEKTDTDDPRFEKKNPTKKLVDKWFVLLHPSWH